MGRRGWLVAAGLMLVAGGGVTAGVTWHAHGDKTAPAASSLPPTVDVAAQSAAVDAILQRRATAVLRGTEAQFLADVDPQNKKLLAAQKVLFGNLVQFGFGKLTYLQGAPQVDQTLIDKYGPTAYLASVMMEYQIKGIDDLPMQTALGYTFVERGGRYLLIDDTHLDTALPDAPHREAWDLGPVLVRRGPRALVVVEPGQSRLAASILAAAQVAVKSVNEWWAPGWGGGGMVIALDDRKVRSADFTGPEGAKDYLIATPVHRQASSIAPGESGYGGAYVVVNPSYRGSVNAPTLTRQFTYLANVPYGDSAPPWLIEGVADYVMRMPMDGQSPVDLDQARALVRSKYLSKAKTLPTDEQFSTAAKSSYAISWYAVDYLIDQYGLAKVIELYREMAGEPGSPARRDATMTKHLGLTETQLFADLKAY